MSDFKQMVTKAISAVIEQGEQSINEDNACMYRHEKGLKCIVGHMITDDVYVRGLESKTVGDDSVRYAVEKSNDIELNNDEVALLGELQECHDFYIPRIDSHGFVTRFKDNILWTIGMNKLPEWCNTFDSVVKEYS